MTNKREAEQKIIQLKRIMWLTLNLVQWHEMRGLVNDKSAIPALKEYAKKTITMFEESLSDVITKEELNDRDKRFNFISALIDSAEMVAPSLNMEETENAN